MNNQMNNQPPIKPPNEKFLWVAFLGAIFMYSVVAIIISQTGEGFVELDSEMLAVLFYAFLFLSIIQLFILFRWSSKVEHKPIETLPENKKNLFMIKYALAEAMAIYGVVLFLMNGNSSHLLLFSGLAVVGMLLSYPKK